MDPWLEDPAGWGSVHSGLIYAIQAELNQVLPHGFIARIEENVWVRDVEDDDNKLLGKPDVYIPSPRVTKGPQGVLIKTLTEPTSKGMLPKDQKRKDRVVQIITAKGREVLTVLEVLRPSNKGPRDREAYIQERREYLATVNLVEIDLLRAGNRLPMGRPEPAAAHYYIFLCRRNEFPATDRWAFTVREKLPVIPVPISSEQADAPLNLRAVLDRVYDDGRYAEELDYTIPPVPPLSVTDADWAVEYLKKPDRN
jgi:hypothetical protein